MFNIHFNRAAAVGALVLALCAMSPAVHAQAAATPVAETPGYPAKPVRILVGFPPGASTDAIARYVADILATAFNKPFLVDNRPGAGGNIAAEVARGAAPDGHTLLLVIAGHVTNRGLYKSLPYEPIRDFTPVNLVARIPFILVAHTSFAGNSVTDVIAIAKNKPGALDYATAGIGSSQHLSGEQFARLSGARWNHVAYKGGAPALLAVASNEVPLALLTTTLVMPMLQKGAIKPIAIAAPTRSPMLPNVPTFAESGMPNYTADTWYGLLAPAGTPQALVNRLSAELSHGLSSKVVRDKFAAQDAYIINAPPVEFARVMQEDDAKWLAIVREARIQAQ